jgi:hypothetical protein
MDIKSKRAVTGAQGSSGADVNADWSDRASSWARGAQTTPEAIQAEAEENDARFGVPRTNALPNPAASNSDADAPLGNPHNFSNNPGFMPGGTVGSLRPGANNALGGGKNSGRQFPGRAPVARPNPTLGRTPSMGNGSIAMPDQQATDPGAGSDVAPQQVTTGFGG